MKRSTALLAVVATGAFITTGLSSGCGIVGLGGAMVESYRRQSTRSVDAEYKGLEGKKWAVIVSANRVIQADNPQAVAYLNSKITERLFEQQNLIGATGYVPSDNILAFQYENPRWIGLPRGELAKQLGVDRLIFVELFEYRLNDPGNQYLWAGVATGTVGVIEVESPLPDEFVFERAIQVAFPDGTSYGPGDMSAQIVGTVLAARFVDRATWLFYRHDEPYYPKY